MKDRQLASNEETLQIKRENIVFQISLILTRFPVKLTLHSYPNTSPTVCFKDPDKMLVNVICVSQFCEIYESQLSSHRK